MTPSRPRRSGLILALALLVLAVLVLVFSALLNRVHHNHTLLRAERRALQSEWLVQSGFERASLQLLDDPDYSGETWLIPASDLGGSASARVQVSVEPLADHPDLRRVRVRADYPDDRWTRVRRQQINFLEIRRNPGPEKDGSS